MNDTEKKLLGEAIRRRREELGLTQDQLAVRLGYRSRSTINKIEKGINDVAQSKLKSFAEALGTTPGALAGWNGGHGSREGDDLRFALAMEAEELDEKQLDDVLNFMKFLKTKKSGGSD